MFDCVLAGKQGHLMYRNYCKIVDNFFTRSVLRDYAIIIEYSVYVRARVYYVIQYL